MNKVWGRKCSPVFLTLVMEEMIYELTTKYAYKIQISF